MKFLKTLLVMIALMLPVGLVHAQTSCPNRTLTQAKESLSKMQDEGVKFVMMPDAAVSAFIVELNRLAVEDGNKPNFLNPRADTIMVVYVPDNEDQVILFLYEKECVIAANHVPKNKFNLALAKITS